MEFVSYIPSRANRRTGRQARSSVWGLSEARFNLHNNDPPFYLSERITCNTCLRNLSDSHQAQLKTSCL